MRCYNFDQEFERYLNTWMKLNADQYKNYDAMEEALPEVYDKFLDTPVKWLGGAKPGEYFTQFDNARELVNWMADYFRQNIPVPDMLLNRISELGQEAEEPLMWQLHRERAGQDLKMAVVTLLREIDSAAPLREYVEWQMNREDGSEDELADNALESLESLGERAVDAMREALPKATPNGQEALLTLLCNYPGDETVFQTAMALFAARRERMAVLADCLGRLGDQRALPELVRLAASEETSYLDYIELRSAIEVLGGDAPEREFDAEDPAYEAMRSMQ